MKGSIGSIRNRNVSPGQLVWSCSTKALHEKNKDEWDKGTKKKIDSRKPRMDAQWSPSRWFGVLLTSRMDWLPSGLILNDPAWMVFLGSTWEMAHSISSTTALHAAWQPHDDKQSVSGGHLFFLFFYFLNTVGAGKGVETRQQPPHRMSCPGLATTVTPRRRHRVRHDASRGAAALILRVPWW